MTACILSPHTIRDIKKVVRSKAAETASSHASEAIARGFGYSSHASLLTELNAFSGGVPLVKHFDTTGLRSRLLELTNHDLEAPLDLEAWAAWKSVSSADRKTVNSWYRRCASLKFPCVLLHKRKMLASIEWDCITVDYGAETKLRTQDAGAKVLVTELNASFRKISNLHGPNRRALFEGSAFYGSVDNLPINVAIELADAYCLIFSQTFRPLS